VPSVEASLRARLAAAPHDSAARLSLATLARLTYRFDEAETLYGALIDTLRPPSRFGPHALLGLAETRIARDAVLAPAAVLYRRAAADAAALGDSGAEVLALLGVASGVVRTGADAASDSIFARAASLLPADDPEVRARFHCARAGPPVQREYGELPERDEAARGAALAQRAGASRVLALCLLGVAKAAYRHGDLAEALAISDSAARIQRRVRDRAGLAVTLQWRGYVLVTTGAYGSAWHALEEASREASASGADATGSMATMFLASASLRLGDIASAAKYAAQTESSLVRQGNTRALTGLRGIQGDIARAAGDTAAARTFYEDALTRAGVFGGYPTLAPRRALAAMARAEGRWDVARAELDAARRAATQVGLAEWVQRLDYDAAVLALERGDLAAADQGFAAYLAQLAPEARGRAYPALARQAEIYARRGDLVRAREVLSAASDELDAWREGLGAPELRLLAFQRHDDLVDPDLGVATILARLAEAGEIDAAFQLAERRRARALRDRLVRQATAAGVPPDSVGGFRQAEKELTATRVAAALPDDVTALVSYSAGARGEPTTAIVVSRGGARAVAIDALDAIRGPAARFVALLESGGPVDRLAADLGRTLLEPVMAVLPPGIRRLIIVPDDVLHRIPFDALRLADGRFAVERLAISSTPSAAVALASWTRPVRDGPATVLAFGDPRFTAPSSGEGSARIRSSFLAGGALTRLAASRGEARLAASFGSSGRVRLGRNATERALKTERLRTVTVLHFATHAIVDDANLTGTALALTPGDGEDGFVSPAEIASLALGAELVVLSACRTAGGKLVGGEGVQGLTSAFLGAGARAVAATAWHVEDERTAVFIADYYRGLAAGLTIGDALREAKLEAMRRGAPVKEWAAWTLIGDPGITLPLRERNSRALWVFIGAGLVLLPLLLYGLRAVKVPKGEARSLPSAWRARTHQP
jgi:hypothetical protein